MDRRLDRLFATYRRGIATCCWKRTPGVAVVQPSVVTTWWVDGVADQLCQPERCGCEAVSVRTNNRQLDRVDTGPGEPGGMVVLTVSMSASATTAGGPTAVYEGSHYRWPVSGPCGGDACTWM